MRTGTRCRPYSLETSRILLPSTITARRTRRYTSTLYIRHTIHGVGYNPMNDGGRYTIRSPILSDPPPTRPTLSPPLTPRIASPKSLLYESCCPKWNATENSGGRHMGGGNSKVARQELVTTVRDRHQQASKKDKGRVLDELTAVTGHHRKHGMKLLSDSGDTSGASPAPALSAGSGLRLSPASRSAQTADNYLPVVRI